MVLACSGDTNLSSNEGLANVTVTLENTQGNTIATTTTDANGNYSFGALAPGTYTVVVTRPAATRRPIPPAAATASVTLTACQSQTKVNFAYTGSTPGRATDQDRPLHRDEQRSHNLHVRRDQYRQHLRDVGGGGSAAGWTIFSQTSVAPGQGFLFKSNYTAGSTTCTLTNTASAIGTAPNGKSATNTSTVDLHHHQMRDQPDLRQLQLAESRQRLCLVQRPSQLHSRQGLHGLLPERFRDAVVQGRQHLYVPRARLPGELSRNCSSGSSSFNGTYWSSTLPCAGDSQIFLSGCGIPWQADFANCHSVCWTGYIQLQHAGSQLQLAMERGLL